MSNRASCLSVATFLLAAAGLAVGGMAWWRAWENQPLTESAPAAAIAIGDVAGVKAAPTDATLDLSSLDEGGNTQLIWHCGKSVVGTRHDYAGAWTHLGGRVLFDPQAKALRAAEVHVDVGAMRGHGEHPAPNALVNTVKANGWFLLEAHPTAVLRTAKVRARATGEEATYPGAVADWTHTLDCTLQLNGVEQPIAVHARLAVDERSVRLDATFPISRQHFEVHGRSGFEPPAEVDDTVVIEVHVNATPDPLAVVAELNRQLVAQQATTGQLGEQVATLTTRLDRFENTVGELQRAVEKAAQAGSGTPAAATIDVTALPKRFTDRVDYRNPAKDARHKDLGYAAEFEMVLVPGDPAKGIAPFYAQTTEVTWQMFRAWSYCEDLADQALAVELKGSLLRPSPCYDDASRGHGFDGRAALGVSRRNALAFCRFVAEQTGRPYRLWTDAEWHHVAALTGGLPAKPTTVAWLADNSDTDDFGEPRSMPVAKKPADALGLFDFWGNVAEWVMADEQFIRGGSYLVTAADLTLEWREDESQDVWNLTYPNTPKSLWWYRDRFDMGFRLVCDPVHLPSGK